MLRYVQTQPLQYWRRVPTPVLPWRPWGPLVATVVVALYLLGAALVVNSTDLAEPVLSQQETTPAQVQASADSQAPSANGASRHHDLVLTKIDKQIVLRGEVASSEEHRALVAAAEAQFSEVDDRLVATHRAGQQLDRFAALHGLSLLTELERGQVTWSEGVLSASGLVSAEREAGLREHFTSLGNTIAVDSLNLRIDQVASSCDAQFSAALSRSTINFATGAATIRDGSSSLLRELAELADQCPGDLVIEGHTDNIGRPRFNRELSLARASAVRDALIAMNVEAERLQAKGFGASQPIADNTSHEGRALNRRIVIYTATDG